MPRKNWNCNMCWLLNEPTDFQRYIDKATNNLRKFSGNRRDTIDGYCSPTGQLLLAQFPCVGIVKYFKLWREIDDDNPGFLNELKENHMNECSKHHSHRLSSNTKK